ncbi:MAG TPA: NUDIX domain-containing protein [Patescibacteria group bacterium]
MELVNKSKDEIYYDQRSAGGIVYKLSDGKTWWLLIKAIKRDNNKNSDGDNSVWKFPKGHLQRDEFLKQAALREVEEEGKVKARIIDKIGSNDYIIWDKLSKKRIIKKVTFFLMEYAGESNLKYFDKEMVVDREWYSFEEAIGLLAYDSERGLLRKAKSKLETVLRSTGH